MANKFVEFTIKHDTNEVAIETIGIKGQACSKVVESLTVGIGVTVKKDDLTSEYFEKEQNVRITNGLK